MSIAISSQMNASLVALTSTVSDVAMTQNRLATGLTVASATDNIAVYFKAKTYSEKGEALDTTNKNISQGVANLTVVDKALSNMKDNIKGARSLLNDALAKPINAGAAVNLANTKTVGAVTTAATGVSYAAVSGFAGATAVTLKGAIVDTNTAITSATGGGGTTLLAANANATSDSVFQAGDVFAMTFNDPNAGAGRTSQTVYFKAANAAAGPVNNSATTGTTANPYVFNDLDSLSTAMNSAFGRSNAAFTLKQETGGNYYLGMQLGSPTQSIAFGQVSEGGTANSTTFDFSKLFGNQTVFGTTVNATLGDSLQKAAGFGFTGAPVASSITYASATATVQDQTAIDTRKQAADFFRQTLLGLASSVQDAYLPGFANILTGGTMSVALNDTNTATQNVSIGGAIDFTKTGGGTTVGLGAFNFGMNATSGNNAYTDTGSATTMNFLSSTSLQNAIAALDNMATTIGQFQKSLAASNVAMSSRLDYNKTVVMTLNSGATNLTAADSNMEAANLAALQNRQSFAVNNMSITKQQEQSLIQLLR